jgi:hypothetical protein
MAAADCLRAIQKAAPNLLDDELDDILTELQRRLDARKAEGQLASLDEAMFDIADQFAREVEEVAMLEKRNRLLNMRRFDDLLAFADRMDQELNDPARAVLATNVGSNVRVPGARKSVDATGNAITTEYLGGMIADLRKADLLPLLNSRELDREIAQELAELSKKVENQTIGVSRSDQAVRIAKVIDKYRRAAVARENRAGAWIKPLEGYVVRQSHDMHKIRRAGFGAWKARVLPLLDMDRTFQGVDPDDFLQGAFDGVASGRHIRSNGADEADTLLAFKGPSNLAKRISQHRVLHFKDADAWFDYNTEFGRGTLMEAVFHDFERAARNTAMMEAWGPNPRAMFDKVLDHLKDKHRTDPKKLNALSENRLQNQFDEIEGITRIPVNPSSAAVTGAVLAVESMAKLGAASLSAITDLGFKAVSLTGTGDNILSSWGRNLESSLEGLSGGDKRVTAELIGVGLDGQIGDLMSRFSATDDTAGQMSKATRIFFKLNLLAPWTDTNKRGLGLMMSRDLAMNADRPWAGLPQRDLLELYGVTEARWNVIRQATRQEGDGRVYLMPDAIRGLPDDVIAQVAAAEGATPTTARALRRVRDDLETSLRSYYTDMAEEAIPTPGARERALLRQGTRPGTPLGIAARLVGQFKAFPVTVLTRQVGRLGRADTTAEFLRNVVNGRADMQGLAHMMVATTVLGYVAQSAKEMAKGRNPRDPTDPKTWLAAMVQGGGAGIYGDFLLGETNRFGRSLLDTLAGPTIGTISDIDELRAKLMAGENSGASALRLAVGNTPFANLFYSRVALDYLFLYQVQEAINPGFLRRTERRLAREQNQTFFLPPTAAIPRGGGDRIFEGLR